MRAFLYVVSALLLLGVLLFVVATRTEIGRNALGRQLEARFASAYHGELAIGRIRGNLRQQVFLSDVRLYDELGRLWLSVDSVVATPHWKALFSRQFRLNRVRVLGPVLTIHEDPGFNSFLRRRSASAVQAWTFDSAGLVIEDGAINAASTKARGPFWAQALREVSLSDLSARAEIETGPNVQHLKVVALSAFIAEKELPIHSLNLQLDATEDSIRVGHLDLRLGATHILCERAAVRRNADAGLDDWQAVLSESEVDLAELRWLLPWKAPEERILIAARLSSSGGTVRVEDASLGWRDSRVLGHTTVRRFADSLQLTLDLLPSVIDIADLESLLPEEAAPSWVLTSSPIQLTVGASGAWRDSVLHLEAAASGQALSGAFELGASLQGSANAGWVYEFAIDADSLAIPPAGALLTGATRIAGSGTAWDNLDASMTSVLGPSRVGGHQIDSLTATATIAHGRELQATVYARRGRQSAHVTAQATLPLQDARFVAELRTAHLDIGPLVARDSVETAITGTFTATGQGLHWKTLEGVATAQIDHADLRAGSRRWSIPEHQLTVRANPPGTGAPRLIIDGDLAQATLRANAQLPVLKALAATYAAAVRESLGRQRMKQWANAGQQPDIPPPAWPPQSVTRSRTGARQALRAAGIQRASVSLDLGIARADWVGAYLATVAGLPYPLAQTMGDATASDHLARLSVDADADAIAVAGSWSDASTAGLELELTAAMEAPLETSLEGSVMVQIPDYEAHGITIDSPRAIARFAHGQVATLLRTGADERFGPAQLDLTLTILDDRYRVTLDSGTVDIAGQRWHLAPGQVADLYWDAVDFSGLATTGTDLHVQHVRVDGLATSGADSERRVAASFEGFSLEQLSEVLEWRHTLGGTLDGALTWSSKTGVAGLVIVDTLRIGNHVAGGLRATSQLNAGAEDVDLTVSLSPLHGPGIRQNNIVIAGTMRPSVSSDSGRLNLAVDIRRLDALFIEELIPATRDARGLITGSGAVRGTISQPVFAADLEIPFLRFELPKQNLLLEADGHAAVDRRGVHFERLAVRDSTGGLADIDGWLLFNDYRFLSFNAKGEFRDFQVMNVPHYSRDLDWYGVVWASGNVTLTGPLDNAVLSSSNITTSPRSEFNFPIRARRNAIDPGFITYREPGANPSELPSETRRTSILAPRPATEREFGAGLNVDLYVTAPEGSTIRLVIDPLLGDVITGRGTARVHLLLREGVMRTHGSFGVTSGDYLFTAGELFARRFLIQEGTIRWTGDPLDPQLDFQAEYRTRASRSGLPEDIGGTLNSSLPLIVDLDIAGVLNAVEVDLSIALDQRNDAISDAPLLEAYLNQPDRTAQHATSVLLTNSFLLSAEGTRTEMLTGSALNSVSQLATGHINRYLSHVLPNADFALGLVSDETAEDLDISAGVALTLLDERLLIRGYGVYRGHQVDQPTNQGLEGEFVVELRLNPNVSVDLFYRREGDALSESVITSETGVGLNYRTQFDSWRTLWSRVIGSSAAEPADTVALPKQ